jgi:hypothetical protein
MAPAFRKTLLLLHNLSALAWLGASACVFALACAGVYGAIGVIWTWVVVPLSITALVTGLAQGLLTNWGLTRHWWVLVKLAVTVLAVFLLVVHTWSLLPALAGDAMQGTANGHGLPPRIHLLIAAGGASVLLVFAATLSIFKPWGKTPFRAS